MNMCLVIVKPFFLSLGFSHEESRRLFFHGTYFEFSQKMYQFFTILLSPFLFSCVAKDSFLYDFVTFNHSEILTTSINCARDCQELSKALQQRNIWALKVEDACGRKPVGFFHGNNYFLGSKYNCGTLNNPPEFYMKLSKDNAMDLKLHKVKSQIAVEYRMLYLEHRSKLQFALNEFNKRFNTIHLGLCLPKSCTEADLELLSDHLIAKSFSNQKDVYGDVIFKKSKRLVLRPDFMSDKLVLLAV